MCSLRDSDGEAERGGLGAGGGWKVTGGGPAGGVTAGTAGAGQGDVSALYHWRAEL